MPDRLAALLASTNTTLNGIDFVEITASDQTALRVHFLNTVAVDGTLSATNPVTITGSVDGTLLATNPVTITGGESVPTVPVQPITATDWGFDEDGRPTLDLRTPFPGDFSRYVLQIASSALDAYYATASFSFKAGCPSTLDCAAPQPCPQAPADGPAIDYLAKDFASFRTVLLDYSASAYPDWVERDEPDLGIMLAEVLSAAGDDLSYLQDRIANQATLATATQRRSVIQHARLVDYEPSPATSARVLMQIDVTTAIIPQSITVEAPLPDGGSLTFELGDGLVDPDTGQLTTGLLRVDPRWNRGIKPYLWDDNQSCLPVGATEMWVQGHGHAFPVGDPQLGTVGIALLIDTAAANPVDPPTREIVHLTAAIEETDQLPIDPATPPPRPVTHLQWDPTEALTAEHDLTGERTVLAGNLVDAVEGRRYADTFVIDPDPSGLDAALAAVARSGPDAGCGDPVPYHLHTLTHGRVAWLARDDGTITPEVCVVQEPAEAGDEPPTWLWRRSLLDADQFETAYTLEPVSYIDIRTDRTSGLPWFEYDGDGADSVRFGTGTFGDRPVTGTRFQVTYRVTSGQAGNIAADSVTTVPLESTHVVTVATNPFPASGGADPEPIEHVRASAPQAFRAQQFRAVRPEDYSQTAEELSWVLGAGTVMRWTGSWATVFTTAQPRGAEQATLPQRVELAQLLGRRRMADYEVYSPEPDYVGLDLIVVVCAYAWAFRGEVEAAVLEQVGTGQMCDGRLGFWAPGQFRFGTPLERSELEAAIQRAHGVEGVVDIWYRSRGWLLTYVTMPETVTVGSHQILRCDQDPSGPDRGSLRVAVEGGK